MRFTHAMLPLFLSTAMLLSGCADEADPVDTGDEADGPPALNATVPDPIRHAGSMPAVLLPVVGGHCVQTCSVSYPFEIEDELDVEVVLVSNQELVSDPTGATGIETDYDLAVLDGSGEIIGESFEFGNTPDRVVATLGPGKYTAEVWTYQDADGSYDLTITFSLPE